MEKVLIIANPTAGGGEGVGFGNELADVFEQKNIRTELYETTGDDDFRKLTDEAMDDGFDTAAILGGDGTISEFVTQISDLKTRPDILLLPLGTTNNLARALQTELNTDELLEKIKENQLVPKQTDVGKINEDYFISTLSAGSLPEIAWKADDEVKEALGSFGYILEGISAINEDQTFDLEIQTKTEEITKKDITLIVIGLSNSVFGIPTFFEEGEINDGDLQLYALKTSDLMEETASLAHHIFPTQEDNEETDDQLSYTTSFKKATIQANTDLHVAVDGEKGPSFPIDLDVLPGHLTFLVPETEN